MKKFLPAKELIIANDKLSKALFTLPSDIYKKIMSINYKMRNKSFDSGEGWHSIFEGHTKKTKMTPAKPVLSAFKLLPSVAPPRVAEESEVTAPKTESVSKVNLESLSPTIRAMAEKMLAARQKDATPPLQNKQVPKLPEVESPVECMKSEDFYEPLNQFDRLVLSACSAEFEKGNCDITTAIIYRDICGKAAGKYRKPTEKQSLEIMKSVYKLAYTKIKIRVKALCTVYGYSEPPPDILEKWTSILPCTNSRRNFLWTSRENYYADRRIASDEGLQGSR